MTQGSHHAMPFPYLFGSPGDLTCISRVSRLHHGRWSSASNAAEGHNAILLNR